VVDGQMAVTTLVPAFSETTVVELRCRIGANVEVFNYPLFLEEITSPTRIRTRLLAQAIEPETIVLRAKIALLGQAIEPETITSRIRVYTVLGGDQYAAQRVLLLHFDGADGSTTFTDSSPAARAITAVGSPTITTSTSRFGGACLNLPGSSRLQFPEISLTGDYTIQAWVRTATPNADMAIAGALTGNNQFLRWNADGVNGGMLSFAVTSIFASTSGVLSGVTANTFVHIAQTREGSVVRDFVNGQLRQTNTSFTNAVIITHIGVGYQGNENYWVGQMDEVSISTVAEYTANFTPRSDPF
jgi:Concanavalin A-like lectin/glucanases superfamily